jgi:eukaryotic-like serine/threonine-protein kinase
MTRFRCPTCGIQYDDGALFCPRDGSRLLALAPSAAAPAASGDAAAPGERAGTAAPTVADIAKLPGRTLDGRYRIERKAGEGGMAFVFLGTDLVDGSHVAVKVMTPSLARDKTSLARLRREADIGSRLAHPNICHIIRLGESDGLVYIVMPFVEGELLCDRTYRRGQLPLPETVRLVSDIAAGLHAAHSLKVVHRDLKPENVMLVRAPDGVERAVIMDFGLARERTVAADAQKLTATGIVLGTPEFMSPEQLRGKPVDARTDVYALGVMTYEMLTGKLPFEGASQQDIMIARLRGDPIPLRQRRPDLDFTAEVERVLARCMAVDAGARYPSAAAFAEALADAAEGRGAISLVLERLLGR